MKAWNILDNHYEDLHVKKGKKSVGCRMYEVAINSTMDFQERRDPSISGESDAVGKLSNF